LGETEKDFPRAWGEKVSRPSIAYEERAHKRRRDIYSALKGLKE